MVRRTPSPPGSRRLFTEPDSRIPADTCLAEVDGASRGNPGPAAYAVVLRSPDGKPVFRLGKYIGRETNNVAEYYGLIFALDTAAARGVRSLRVHSDSELMVQQMKGRYKVKSPGLKPLHEKAKSLARGFDFFAIEHVYRENNREADALANAALDARGTVGEAPPPGDEGSLASVRAGISSGASRAEGAGSAGPQRHSVRARYSQGALIPDEPLDLREGAKVNLTIDQVLPKR
jgi:ribonuclease HI